VATPLAVGAGIVFTAGLLLARVLARPLTRLAEAAGALAEGRSDQPVPDVRTTRELARLADALARLDRARPAPVATLYAIQAAAE
jgi:HAMP domain-containing protein